MRKLILLLIIGIIFVSFISGCSKNPVSQEASEVSREDVVLNCFKKKNLMAGRNIWVGKVTLGYEQVGDVFYLIVRFATLENWYLNETHVYFGDAPPQKHSPGRFPYKHEIDDIGPNASVDTFIIPLPADWEFFYFSSHADVISTSGQEETAWGENEFEFEQGWGWYCEIPNPVYSP